MHIYNEPARTEKNSESGLVWEEKISGAQSAIEVPKYSPVRVRAVGATIVTIGGVLSATMVAGEIIIFNAGIGDIGATGTDVKRTVSVVITGANAFVQVARTVEKKREDTQAN